MPTDYSLLIEEHTTSGERKLILMNYVRVHPYSNRIGLSTAVALRTMQNEQLLKDTIDYLYSQNGESAPFELFQLCFYVVLCIQGIPTYDAVSQYLQRFASCLPLHS